MKKAAPAIALVLALLAGSGPVLAQSSIVSQIAGDKAASDRLCFGLKFGLSCSQLRGLGYGDRLGGFDLGLAATVKLAEKLYLSPEVTLFSRKGATEIPFVTTGDPALDPYFADPEQAELALDYFDLPVIVKYRLGRFHVGAGPFVALLGSATERFRAVLESGETMRFSRDVKAGYKPRDYGLVFEGSWTVAKPRRGMGLVFHFRYQAGMTDVIKDPAAPRPVRNSVFQVSMSFPFVR